jgi:hypothetical protein
MIDTKLGAARLLDFLPEGELPSESLLELTGDSSKFEVGRFPSGLERRIAEAWQSPMTDLSCGHCRMLVGQVLGIRWLARPVTAFVAKHPQAECDLYPGDLTVVALIAWRELSAFAPEEVRTMLAQDFDWLRRDAEQEEWEGSIIKEAIAALDEALR